MISGKAQITKGNWLTGGTASFTNTKSESQTFPTYKNVNLDLSPTLGYFLADKFAIGISPAFTWGKGESLDGTSGSNTKRYTVGPFIRYYLLDKENLVNILTTGTYSFGGVSLVGAKGSTSSYQIGAGPVIFFNSSVALELFLGYGARSEKVERYDKTVERGFQTRIGLQFHLERE